MDAPTFALARGVADDLGQYIAQAEQSRRSRTAMIRTLLANRRMPEDGWDDATIHLFLREIASMDSNNFPGNVGGGEREGRIFSSIVRDRYFGLAHGIGRSGDVGAVQPKAAGSSLLLQISCFLALDAIKMAGFTAARVAAVLPVATGMSLTLVLSALRDVRPSASRVLFLRIDQKSCLKSSITAGFAPCIISGTVRADEVCTDMEKLREELNRDTESVLCVMSTTSCFAPRAPDYVVEIARICRRFDVPHVVNNAYGAQSRRCCHLIDTASRDGRVDVVVQSLDKNFLLPVSGAVLAARDKSIVQAACRAYPGRASVSSTLDLTITLLSMGRSGWAKLLDEREDIFRYMQEQISRVAQKHGERLLETPQNPISIAMTLSRAHKDTNLATTLGSMLFTRFVSGTRVVPIVNPKTKVCGIHIPGGFGAHCEGYPVSYLTAAAAIGMTASEVDTLCSKLDACLDELHDAKSTTTD